MLDLIFIINQFTHTLTEFNLRTIQFELYADKQRILAGQDLYNAMASFFYLAFVFQESLQLFLIILFQMFKCRNQLVFE